MPAGLYVKVIKPEAEKGLRQELLAFYSLGSYLQENSTFYDLGDFPLADLFDEIRDALAKEILVVEEQRNLARALRDLDPECHRHGPR